MWKKQTYTLTWNLKTDESRNYILEEITHNKLMSENQKKFRVF